MRNGSSWSARTSAADRCPRCSRPPARCTPPTGGTALTTFTSDIVWASWNTTYSTTSSWGSNSLYTLSAGYTTSSTIWTGWNTAWRESAEQRARREQHQAQAASRHQARAVASARAEELLLALLTEEQAATYQEHGWFEVRGSRGGRWRIRNRGQSGNVDLMPEIGEERQATYCAHPPDHLPDADAWIAQMLHLVTDEEGFRKVANLHWRAA